MFFSKVRALRCFERGNPLADWLEEPRPLEGELVVTKQYASAFFGTSLAATLTAMGADTVVLCGLSTSGCVRATGIDAVQHGFRPMVVADACGDPPSAPTKPTCSTSTPSTQTWLTRPRPSRRWPVSAGGSAEPGVWLQSRDRPSRGGNSRRGP
ncbi:MAG: isochorismatase family protein [Microthrixaceae bacterium]